MKPPGYFILGSTGFIGQQVLRHLLKTRRPITCLIHRSSLPTSLSSRVRCVSGSLEQFQPEWLDPTVTGALIHLARISGSTPWTRRLAARKSARAHKRLLSYLHNFFPDVRLVLVAGTLAYGDAGDTPIDEHTPLSPVSFARYYAAGEAPLVEAITRGRIKGLVLRPAWVYGNGSWFKQLFLLPMKHRAFVPLYGEGKNWMTLIHVADCAGQIVHLTDRGCTGRTYNVYAGEPLQQFQLAEMLSQITGLPIQRVPLHHLRSRYGKPVAEAFAIAQKVTSCYRDELQQYPLSFPDLLSGLRHVVQSFFTSPSPRSASFP